MPEKIVRAKRYDQLWFLDARDRFEIINVIAWGINDSGPAVPITAFGRFDVTKAYVVGNGQGYIAFPEGRFLSDSNAVYAYLKYDHVF